MKLSSPKPANVSILASQYLSECRSTELHDCMSLLMLLDIGARNPLPRLWCSNDTDLQGLPFFFFPFSV